MASADIDEIADRTEVVGIDDARIMGVCRAVIPALKTAALTGSC